MALHRLFSRNGSFHAVAPRVDSISIAKARLARRKTADDMGHLEVGGSLQQLQTATSECIPSYSSDWEGGAFSERKAEARLATTTSIDSNCRLPTSGGSSPPKRRSGEYRRTNSHERSLGFFAELRRRLVKTLSLSSQ